MIKLDLDPAKLVFIDETWTATNMARTHGRCRKGARLRMGFRTATARPRRWWLACAAREWLHRSSSTGRSMENGSRPKSPRFLCQP